MKLRDVFEVTNKNSKVWVLHNDEEYEDAVYRIEWFHNELLDRVVKHLGADGETINIVLE